MAAHDADNVNGTSVHPDRAGNLTDLPKKLTNLPHELLLRIIAAASYTPQNFAALSQVSRSFHVLMQQHATSLSRTIKCAQFPIQSALYGFEDASPDLLKSVQRRQASVERLVSACGDAGEGMVGERLQLKGRKVQAAAVAGLMFGNAKAERDGRFTNPNTLPEAVVLRLYLACATTARALCHVCGFEDEEDHRAHVHLRVESRVLWTGFAEFLAILGMKEAVRCKKHAAGDARGEDERYKRCELNSWYGRADRNVFRV